MSRQKIKIKRIKPILVVSIEGEGRIPDFDKDIDRLYEYIYKNNLQESVAGPTIGLFYTEFGGKYIAAVPIKKRIPVSGEIKIQVLPAIRCMSILHKGSPETIEESFNLLKQYQKANNLSWLFPVREIYIPTKKEGEYIIEIQVPIAS